MASQQSLALQAISPATVYAQLRDLVPSGHLAMALIGEGEVMHAGRRVPARSWQQTPINAPVKLGVPGAAASSDRMLASSGPGSRDHSPPSSR